MLEASEVLDAAAEVPGMVAYFSLAGSAVAGGRSLVAYRMFSAAGLAPFRANELIESWAHMAEMESATGWAPEAAAMAYVISEVEHWRRVHWRDLVVVFALSANPEDARPGR